MSETYQPPQFEVTPISLSDLNEVIALGAVTPEFQTSSDAPPFYSREILEKWVQSENGVTLCVKNNNVLVGFFLGQAMVSGDGYFNVIAVRPEDRGKDVAEALMAAALTEFQRLGCRHMFGLIALENSASLALAAKFGFKPGKAFYYTEMMLHADESSS